MHDKTHLKTDMSLMMSAISNLTGAQNAAVYSNLKNVPVSNTENNSALISSSIGESFSGVQKIIEGVKNDPQLAKEMVEVYTFIPDRELYNIDDVPSDFNEWQAWQNRTIQFSQLADDVTQQRIEIYNNMKAAKINDADIFQALMEFNKSLPMDYQLKTGLSRYSIYA